MRQVPMGDHAIAFAYTDAERPTLHLHALGLRTVVLEGAEVPGTALVRLPKTLRHVTEPDDDAVMKPDEVDVEQDEDTQHLQFRSGFGEGRGETVHVAVGHGVEVRLAGGRLQVGPTFASTAIWNPPSATVSDLSAVSPGAALAIVYRVAAGAVHLKTAEQRLVLSDLVPAVSEVAGRRVSRLTIGRQAGSEEFRLERFDCIDGSGGKSIIRAWQAPDAVDQSTAFALPSPAQVSDAQRSVEFLRQRSLELAPRDFGGGFSL